MESHETGFMDLVKERLQSLFKVNKYELDRSYPTTLFETIELEFENGEKIHIRRSTRKQDSDSG